MNTVKYLLPFAYLVPALIHQPVIAQSSPYPQVNSWVEESRLTNAQCLQRASSVLKARGYANFSTVGDSTDMSFYGRFPGTTVVIRCATKHNLAIIIVSTFESSGEMDAIASSFFGNSPIEKSPGQIPYSPQIERQHPIQVGADRSGCGLWLNPNSKVKGDIVESTILLQMKGNMTGTGCRGVFELRSLTARCSDRSVRVQGYPAWEGSNRFETSEKIINALCR